MKVGSLDNSISALLGPDDNTVSEAKSAVNDNQPGFIDYLKGALGEVDKLQKTAQVNADKLALGDQSYLHSTMIAYEKANLALQLTIEVRNRVVEAYQEISRIQM
jgi:flagellar hook-basal body complex protein FliE